MKRFVYFLLVFFVGHYPYAQVSVPDFSHVPGDQVKEARVVKIPDGYVVYTLHWPPGAVYPQSKLYKINEGGEVTGTFDLNFDNRVYIGMPYMDEDGRLFFLGTYEIEGSPLLSQRYAGIEFDYNFNVKRDFEFYTFFYENRRPYSYNSAHDWLSDAAKGNTTTFIVKKDTFYGAGRYILSYKDFHTGSHVTSHEIRYFKSIISSRKTLSNHDDMSHLTWEYIHFEFKDDALYLFGPKWIEGEGLFRVMKYNLLGQPMEVCRFDASGTYNNGGHIDDKLFMSYRDDLLELNLDGCMSNSIVIDVRDAAFDIIHRFKIQECNYVPSGNMPFAKGKDGSIYYQAVHENYNRFLLQKYTSDMSLIWSKEYVLDSSFPRYAPMQLVPTEDGGVLIVCFQWEGTNRKTSLHKVDADGNPLTTSVFEASSGSASSALSPNPFQSIVRYTGAHEGPLMAMVHSMDGRLVREVRLQSGMLDLSGLAPGVYSVLLMDAERPGRVLHRQRLVKMRD